MASQSEIYEANAQACEHQARIAKDAQAKEAYLQLARSWRSLAHDIGRADHFYCHE